MYSIKKKSLNEEACRFTYSPMVGGWSVGVVKFQFNVGVAVDRGFIYALHDALPLLKVK